MLKHSLLVFLSLTCLKLCFAAPAEVKRCVFSIEIIRDGGGMWPTGYTAVGDGVFLFEHADGRITGERYEQWNASTGLPRELQKEVFARGNEFTRRVRELFKKCAIRELDFNAAVAAAQRAMPEEKMFVNMGAKTVKVFAGLEGTRFSFSANGLGWHLEIYGTYSAKLRELKSLLDGVAYEYGRSRIFID